MNLDILDYSDKIAALPQHKGYQVLPARVREGYISFHYSGVAYVGHDEATELRRILDEAKYQLAHDYGGGAYPDGLLYDFVVLASGRIVRTRKHRQQLWHVGNKIGNRDSWSAHVMLGGKQDVTPPQKQSLFNLFDALRVDSGIPRDAVVAHCEWPRVDGLPILASSYRLLPKQSQCPGAVLFSSVVLEYRNAAKPPVTPAGAFYTVKAGGGTLRTTPFRNAANIKRGIPAGASIQIVGTAQGESVLGSTVWLVAHDGSYLHSSAATKT